MQIVLNEENYKKIIDKAISILSKGGIIVYPSDTVYGIAVDGTNGEAIKKLEELKGRRPDQKFSFNFSDYQMIEKYLSPTDKQKVILKKYLPGPYTFVIAEDVSLRVPKDSIIVDITRAYGKPTTATSANLTGSSPATSIKNLHAKIYLKADLLIEKTDFKAHKPSTVVDIQDDEPRVIREGELPFP